MTTELGLLAIYGLIILLVLLVQVLAAMGQVGLTTLAHSREDMPELTGLAGRMERALRNCIVSMALFAPAVLIHAVEDSFSGWTLLAAQLFVAARLLYVLVYAAGIPWLRTLVWLAGFLATAFLYVSVFL